MPAFDNPYVSCSVSTLDNRMLRIQGKVKNAQKYVSMQLLAAHPIQQMTSYSGSGLPFACPNMAFHNTPNNLNITGNGQFDVQFSYPNSYYTNDGLQRIPPSLFFVLVPAEGDPDTVQFKLDVEDPLQLRSLTHRPGRSQGSWYYQAKDDLLGVPTTAENTMRAYKEYKLRLDYA